MYGGNELNFSFGTSFFSANGHFASAPFFLKSHFYFLTQKNFISSRYFNPVVLSSSWVEKINYENFIYLKKSSFISFFINNFVDIPICFKKSKSLRSKNFELPILKFSNYLMKRGLREQTLILIFKTFRNFAQPDTIYKNKIKNYKTLDKDTLKKTFFYEKNNIWLTLYFSINGIFWMQRNNHQTYFNVAFSHIVKNNHFLYNNDKWVNTNAFVKSNFILRLTKIFPIFSYFIYSVDKNIRKYSRGKSGKYVFVWKYVAYYKRIYIALRWIAKEIKFNQDRKISDRLIRTFVNMEKDIESSFAWKSKVFSHNYVFKNFKKTLMLTLKTTI